MALNHKDCSCPICRFSRGEISAECFAWYLKGKIEMAESVLNTKDKTDLPIKWDKALEYSQSEDSCLLDELIEKRLDNPDKALLKPKEFVLEN